MTISEFIASLRSLPKAEALSQIEGALWAETFDPILSEADRQTLVRAKLEIMRRTR